MTSLFAIFDRDAIRDFFAPKPDDPVIIRSEESRFDGLPGVVRERSKADGFYQVAVGGELVWFTEKELEVVEAEEIDMALPFVREEGEE